MVFIREEKYSQNGKLIYSKVYNDLENRRGYKGSKKWRSASSTNIKKYKDGKMIYQKYYFKGKISKYYLYNKNTKGKVSYVKKHYYYKSNGKTKKTLYIYVGNRVGSFKSTKKLEMLIVIKRHI